MSDGAGSSARGIFHGWFVVAGAFGVTFVGFGSAYTFSAFVEPLQRNFGAKGPFFDLCILVAYGVFGFWWAVVATRRRLLK